MRFVKKGALSGIVKSRYRYAVFYVIGFAVLALSFAGNIFGVGPDLSWYSNFQKDSESIITKTVDCRNSKHALNYSGPVKAKDLVYGPGCSPDQYIPYESQFGLQSRIIAFLAPADEGIRRYYYLCVMLFLALAMAAVMLALVFFVHREFGGVVGVTLLGMITISNWLVAYAPNMYWIAFVMFLPFVFSFGYYEYYKTHSKLKLFYSLLVVMFMLKYFNGYEHASTLTLSALVPIVYFELKSGAHKHLYTLWRQAAYVLVASAAGFVIALTLHVTSLQSFYHSWSKAAMIVAGRVDERTDTDSYRSYVVHGFQYGQPVLYERINRIYALDTLKDGTQHSFKYTALSALHYLLLPALSLPVILREPLGTIVQSISFVGLVAGILLYRLKSRRQVGDSRIVGLKAAYWLSLIGAISWLVIMPGHAYVHAHLNGIVFYMPYLLICYIIFGLVISRWVRGPRTSL
jgi:hypothetical protein